MAGKTIIAPASALGRGGVSVIRMSGDHSKQIAEAMCGSLAESWKFKKCKIRSSEGQVLDSGMVVFLNLQTLTPAKMLWSSIVTVIQPL